MDARQELIEEILVYESDTFSSSGSEITREEAEKIADNLIREIVFERIDGVMFSEELENIRPEENENGKN